MFGITWRKKSRIPSRTERFYGGDKTIHSTQHLDVATKGGKVVAVWFRCQALPFQQYEMTPISAKEMQEMYARMPDVKLTGVYLEESSR